MTLPTDMRILKPSRMTRIVAGDARDALRLMRAESVHVIACSPPYFGLRSYDADPSIWQDDVDCDHDWNKGGSCRNRCGAWHGCLGLEPTPEQYCRNIVEIFREARRVLRDDGTCWVVIGDSYAQKKGRGHLESRGVKGRGKGDEAKQKMTNMWASRGAEDIGLKPKDLIGIPWMMAFALRADGWWLRQEVIWCLSGGVYVYARTQKGDMPVMIKGLYQLDPKTVKLWNGKRWTQLLGMIKSRRKGDEIRLELRSGEIIQCTPGHQFPTERGLLMASDIVVGDVLKRTRLPESENPRDCVIDEDAAWLAGLYLAEGSKSGDTIQISGHASEEQRWNRLQDISQKFGGYATRTVDGNGMSIRLYGKVLNALLAELVAGRIAKNKRFASVVWRYSNRFLSSMLDGYLSGDGHDDVDNKRWRIGFTRNDYLARDLRTACARLGYTITLKPSFVTYQAGRRPAYRGEIRKSRSGHRNEKSREEIVAISRSNARNFYDLSVKDEPHLFALASGILTHNSKPNSLPEPVRDRCTRSHEYIFMFTRSARYYYDQDAIRERHESEWYEGSAPWREGRAKQQQRGDTYHTYKDAVPFSNRPNPAGRNKRSVWNISTRGVKDAHFAVYPKELVQPMIKAGTSEKGCCEECGAPWRRVVERTPMKVREGPGRKELKNSAIGSSTRTAITGTMIAPPTSRTVGWEPGCGCGADVMPCTVLDPFCGSGTTLVAARRLACHAVGIELNPEYARIAHDRIRKDISFQLRAAFPQKSRR